MALSPAFLDELRARTQLSALVGKGLKLERAGREWRACCPFHDEKTPSFYVNDDKGFYHCFGCSAHGDAIRWLTDRQGLPFIDAVKELAAAAGLDMPAPDPQAAARAERAQSLHDVMAGAQAWFAAQLESDTGADARDYLHKRGIDEAAVARFGIGFAPDTRTGLRTALARYGDAALLEAGLLIAVDDKPLYDRFRGRLMIPIRDVRGRAIAFGGRTLGDGEPKYLNSPDTPLFDKGRTLYNIDHASKAARGAGRVIVVEGYLDVIALAGAGIDEVVAPLGTALTEAHLARCWRLADEPVLCFDGDNAGRKAAVRAALRALPLLEPGKSLRFAALPAGMDPDDLLRRHGTQAFDSVLALTENLSDLLWRTELDRQPYDTPEKRAGLRSTLEALASGIHHDGVKNEYSAYFRRRFFDQFGLKPGGKFRVADVAGIRRAASHRRSARLGSVDAVIWRAMLLGLSRFTDVLFGRLEQLQRIDIAEPYLAQWRDILVEAAYADPSLDEDAIETILAASNVAPLEKRNLHRDLRFSFFAERGDRARDDLLNVIDVSLAWQQMRSATVQAEARFGLSLSEEDWAYTTYLRAENEAVKRKRADLVFDLDQLAA